MDAETNWVGFAKGDPLQTPIKSNETKSKLDLEEVTELKSAQGEEIQEVLDFKSEVQQRPIALTMVVELIKIGVGLHPAEVY